MVIKGMTRRKRLKVLTCSKTLNEGLVDFYLLQFYSRVKVELVKRNETKEGTYSLSKIGVQKRRRLSESLSPPQFSFSFKKNDQM